MKKQSNLSRLLDYAGTYRILTYLSWVLAAAGALLALAPFGYIIDFQRPTYIRRNKPQLALQRF